MAPCPFAAFQLGSKYIRSPILLHKQQNGTCSPTLTLHPRLILFWDAQARPPDAAPPHHMVLDFEPGQAAYDVDAMESPAEHPDVADARTRRKAGPAPVTLISCLEAWPAFPASAALASPCTTVQHIHFGRPPEPCFAPARGCQSSSRATLSLCSVPRAPSSRSKTGLLSSKV